MCMTGHCIPYTAGLQLCHSHFQLAAFYLTGQNILADNSVVCILQGTKLYLILRFYNNNTFLRCSFRLNQHGRACSVCRCRIQIILCRILAVITGKYNILWTHADVHSFLEANLVHLSVNSNCTGTADIDYSQFTPLAEILCTKFITCCQSKRFNRYCCSCDNSVNVAVYQLDFAGYEKILNQKLFSQTLCGIMLHIFWWYCCSKFHLFPLLPQLRKTACLFQESSADPILVHESAYIIAYPDKYFHLIFCFPENLKALLVLLYPV